MSKEARAQCMHQLTQLVTRTLLQWDEHWLAKSAKCHEVQCMGADLRMVQGQRN